MGNGCSAEATCEWREDELCGFGGQQPFGYAQGDGPGIAYPRACPAAHQRPANDECGRIEWLLAYGLPKCHFFDVHVRSGGSSANPSRGKRLPRQYRRPYRRGSKGAIVLLALPSLGHARRPATDVPAGGLQFGEIAWFGTL